MRKYIALAVILSAGALCAMEEVVSKKDKAAGQKELLERRNFYIKHLRASQQAKLKRLEGEVRKTKQRLQDQRWMVSVALRKAKQDIEKRDNAEAAKRAEREKAEASKRAYDERTREFEREREAFRKSIDLQSGKEKLAKANLSSRELDIIYVLFEKGALTQELIAQAAPSILGLVDTTIQCSFANRHLSEMKEHVKTLKKRAINKRNVTGEEVENCVAFLNLLADMLLGEEIRKCEKLITASTNLPIAVC